MREEQAEQMNSTPSVLPQPCVFIPGPADAQREVKLLGDPDLRRQCPVMAATVGEPRLDSNNPTHPHPPPPRPTLCMGRYTGRYLQKPRCDWFPLLISPASEVYVHIPTLALAACAVL